MLEKSLSFLTILKENNYKEWFHENKSLYEEAKKEFEHFTTLMIAEVIQIDKSVTAVEPKDCIFRLFRDVRFANDKTPYKTNFGAFVAARGGRKSEYGGYYLHLEPDRCMIGGGVWMPQPDVLKAIRQEIYHNVEPFLELTSSAAFTKYFKAFDTESVLKTAPKDFPKDWPHIALLKYKSYTVTQLIGDEVVLRDNFLDTIREVFLAMKPFNSYLNRAITDLRE